MTTRAVLQKPNSHLLTSENILVRGYVCRKDLDSVQAPRQLAASSSSLFMGPRRAVEDSDRSLQHRLHTATLVKPLEEQVKPVEEQDTAEDDADGDVTIGLHDTTWVNALRCQRDASQLLSVDRKGNTPVVFDVDSGARSPMSSPVQHDAVTVVDVDDTSESSDSAFEEVVVGARGNHNQRGQPVFVDSQEEDSEEAVFTPHSGVPPLLDQKPRTQQGEQHEARLNDVGVLCKEDRHHSNPPLVVISNHRTVLNCPLELQDLIELLHFFDIRFVISPSEADAQCSFLSRCGVVDAVFTEDSDVVAHGASHVLRGFFADGADVRVCSEETLSRHGLDRAVLMALTQLLGCDYVDGLGISVSEAVAMIALVRDTSSKTTPRARTYDDDTLLQMHLDSLCTEGACHANKALEYLLRLHSFFGNQESSCSQNGDSWMDDASVAQRHLLHQALHSARWSELDWSRVPQRNALMLFTDAVPLNRLVTQRPPHPQPDWTGLRLWLRARGMSHLTNRVDSVEKKRSPHMLHHNAHLPQGMSSLTDDQVAGNGALDVSLRLLKTFAFGTPTSQ